MKNEIKTPKKIAVAWHPSLPKAKTEAEKIADYLSRCLPEPPECFSLNDTVLRQRISRGCYDLVITLGGDGTMIRTGKLCAAPQIPVMGINMGSFGFLIETQPDQWPERIERLLRGDWNIEKRMMLHAEHIRNGEILRSWEVLNDAVVGRGSEFRPVHLRVRIDGALLEEYVADGLIVSSATGSTAYAMAASGPVLAPEMRNMLLLPIAPHLCLDKTLVLQEDDVVEIQQTSPVSTNFCPDGIETVPLQEGDVIRVCASEYSAEFVRFTDQGAFYRDFTRRMQRRPVMQEKES